VLWPFFEPHHEVQEGCRILLLDRGNRLKGVYTVSLGGMTATMADPRLIFSVALRTLSCSIILAHNHPSGQCRPSSEDLHLTRKLVDGGKLLDIQVSDHIILAGPDSYYSFAENNHL
jgi:DNA repair protein RadC